MLSKALVELGFAEGVDRKSNAKLTLPGKLLRLENGVFREGGTIRKRNGYTSLSREVQGGDDLEAGEALGRFRDELLLFNAGEVFSRSTALAKWVSRGEISPIGARSEPIFGSKSSASNPDVASSGSVTVYAWADSRGGVRASVVDEETGTMFLADTEVSATGVRPKCVLIGAHLFVLYIEGTDLKAKRISTLDPAAFSAEFVLRVDVEPTAAQQHLDVIPFSPDGAPGESALFVYTTNGDVTVAYLLETGVVGDGATGYPGPVSLGIPAEQALTIAGSDDASLNAGLVFAANASGLYAVAVADVLDLGLPVEVYAGAGVVNVTATIGIPFDSGDGVHVFFEMDDAADTEHSVFYVNTDEGGTGPAPSEILLSVGLASKAFMQSGTPYVNTVYGGTYQSHFFTIDSTGRIHARLLSQNAGGVQEGQIPAVVEMGDDFFWSAPFQARATTEANRFVSLIGVAKSTLTFGGPAQYRGVQAGENLLIPGGVVSIYDGAQVVEAGFHVFPEGIEDPAQDDMDGAMDGDGRYAFTWIYEWYDAKGQVHRSAPAIPVLVNVPAGTATNSCEFEVPTLRLTSKENVRIVCYSTKLNGLVWYRTPHEDGSATDGVDNDPTVDTVTFKRTVSDEDIEANEIIYSQGVNAADGGSLPHVCPPAARHAFVGKGRAILSGLENPYRWLYSKRITEGNGVAFSDFLLGEEIDRDGGELTAGAILDDKIVLFKRDAIYIVAGDGPDNAGLGGEFAKPFKVNTDVGCVEPRSIVETPDGLMFQSAKGIYTLTRGLAVEYSGAWVEAFNGQTITAATLVDDANEVRFLTDDGHTLVYDYFFKQWATWTNHEGVAAELYDGAYHYLRADGSVLVEDDEVFTDDGDAIHLLIRTGWIKPGSIQGLKRIWRAALLGDFYSDHRLRGRIYRDWQDVPCDTFTWNPGAIFDTEDFGDGNFGDGNFGGGGANADRVYQVRHHLKRQKVQSISIEISDIGGAPGQAFALSALGLEVGMLPGLARLAQSKNA